MIEIPINDDYMNRAREKASTVGILQGSITGGTSNVVGAIGFRVHSPGNLIGCRANGRQIVAFK